MSDPYDSLEDECDEKDTSPNSMNECPAVALDFRETISSPFYLNRKVTEKKGNLINSFQYEKEGLESRNFLPKIENAAKGWDPTSNIIVDNEVLKEQGLQINSDGSFTKSPRAPWEELPFITREYRNLQFQRKKTYRIAKNIPRAKICKKNIFSFTKSPVDGISMSKIISARQEKGSSEEILTSADSVSSRMRNLPKDKELLENDNLTDSMKEKLLSQTDQPPETLRKTKRVLNLLEDRKSSQQSKGSTSKWASQRTNAERKQSSFCSDRLVSNQRKSKTSNSVVPKQTSDILLKGSKPSLSYSERRQLQSGFNPLHLRQGKKKVLSDTNRSNFGDSTEERLSEISSRILSTENLPDEDEELFYRELMKKDRIQNAVQRSSRSEGPNDFPNLKKSDESGSFKELKEGRQNSSRFKPIAKSMSIDLPSENVGVVQALKKYPHYCSANSSPNMSKVELALKGKTYGYLANARNIFKMKAQSEGKLGVKGENAKPVEKGSDSEKRMSGRDGPKKTFPSTSVLPEIPGKLPLAFDKALKEKKPPCRTKDSEMSKNGLQGFALPPVAHVQNRDSKIQMEILNRISSCLNSPNVRIDG